MRTAWAGSAFPRRPASENLEGLERAIGELCTPVERTVNPSNAIIEAGRIN